MWHRTDGARRRRLENIEKEVPLKYARMQREVSGGADVENLDKWLEGLLDGARQTLASCALKVGKWTLNPEP